MNPFCKPSLMKFVYRKQELHVGSWDKIITAKTRQKRQWDPQAGEGTSQAQGKKIYKVYI